MHFQCQNRRFRVFEEGYWKHFQKWSGLSCGSCILSYLFINLLRILVFKGTVSRDFYSSEYLIHLTWAQHLSMRLKTSASACSPSSTGGLARRYCCNYTVGFGRACAPVNCAQPCLLGPLTCTTERCSSTAPPISASLCTLCRQNPEKIPVRKKIHENYTPILFRVQ